LAGLFAAEGASLNVHYHSNLSAAEQLRKLLEPSPASLVQADLSSTDSISRMVESRHDDKLAVARG
jgi:hypothetical protein